VLPRLLLPELRRRLTRYPAVALDGPRQCGKTTLALALGDAYYDLEQQADRLRLDLEWAELTAGSARTILDEAQAWPEIFARVRGAIDQNRKRNGRFLLLGSVSPALAAQASESLTGRLSTMELTPLRWRELPRARRALHWLCGGFPDGGILEPVAYPEWQQDYLTLVVQRDLPTWGLPARPQVTDRLLRMLAAVHASPSWPSGTRSMLRRRTASPPVGAARRGTGRRSRRCGSTRRTALPRSSGSNRAYDNYLDTHRGGTAIWRFT